MQKDRVFWKGIQGPANDDGQDIVSRINSQLEGPNLERQEIAVPSARSLGEIQDGRPSGQPVQAHFQAAAPAFFVASFDRNIAVQAHVPAEQRDVEHLFFGDPFKMNEGVEQNQDVDPRLVIGNDDV